MFEFTAREALLMLGVAALGSLTSFALLPIAPAIFTAILAPLIVFIAVYDLKYLIIPDWAVLVMFVLGLIFSTTQFEATSATQAAVDGVFRMAIAVLTLAIVRQCYELRSGTEGLGFGDIKLAGAGALFLHWGLLPFVLASATLGCGLAIGCRIILSAEPFTRQTEIPFGAFLGPAIWFALVLDQSGFTGAFWLN
jgi:prepilin signal peptidase PulO-like enzyme (type II secretory pathway)